MTIRFPFDNSYVRLPEAFHAAVRPAPARAPRLIRLNRPLARELGLDPDQLETPEGAAVFAGVSVPEAAEPIALAYAGHQFGHFVPELGDGRAILLGEVVDKEGRRRDIQLKGSGPTPFSRRGDGRAALGPVLREYIVSEAMAALGIPTTRSLAAATTGEAVYRETALPGAVLTRVAASHIRVGTFQYFAARGDLAGLQRLLAYAIERHDPAAAAAATPARAFLEGVVARQAALVARWLLVGFIHGVMNTDNMAVSGETIDYGPCAFLDAYEPTAVFSSIDRMGRYAFANQPTIAQWNLTRLAECLIPVWGREEEAAVAEATEVLTGFPGHFNAAYLGGLRAKLGLATEEAEDLALSQDLLRLMAEGRADHTNTFRDLSDLAGDPAREATVRAQFGTEGLGQASALTDWLGRWRARLQREARGPEATAAAMRAVNPALIPRNHRIEAAIVAAVEREDFAPFERLVEALAQPFADRPDTADLRAPPVPEERVLQTFCGT